MRNPHLLRRSAIGAIAVGAILALASCSAGTSPSSSAEPATDAEPAGARVAVAYEGGILVLDGETLEIVGDFQSEPFTRLNAAGDDRHVMVTMSEGFQVLDTAAGSADDPELTDQIFKADTPGHVVRHAGRTLLYADGTSDTTIFDPAELGASELPAFETVEGAEAHHGVSIMLEDGTFLTTVGNADGRNGIVAKDASGHEIARSDKCPGVHGEGTAKGEVVVFGCEDGALVYSGGQITKVAAPDQPYGRMGNAFVSETSAMVVGDYKSDADAEGYLLDAVTLIDTEAMTLDVIDLPEGAAYTFRDIARGPDDLAYILASDGAIHVLDPETGEFTDSHPVVGPWEGPREWQDPHPAIVVTGDVAYITEPAASSVHLVDLITGEVLESAELDVTPNEIAAAVG
ncbi:zinc metallochaperone AztD [Microbacterium alcoholitolerans]|uniref:zinc metallochaperone AztD n=1 Tax=unclassified Microbacterium TaxID=2609290 RepID=UPI003D164A3E